MKLFRFVPSFRDRELMLIEPTPVKDHVPEWYRMGESTYTEANGSSHPAMKSCAPFLDIMLTGYVILTPFDIFVGKNEDGSHNIRWNGPEEWGSFVHERPHEMGATIPRPAGHSPNPLIWGSKWGWKVPRGHSVIVTHPYNRYDLPFTTLSGLIDSDKYITPGNIPFFLKEDFVGIIPAGTPIVQLIPFKRGSWKKVADYGLISESIEQGEKLHTPDPTTYKKHIWVRKTYN